MHLRNKKKEKMLKENPRSKWTHKNVTDMAEFN